MAVPYRTFGLVIVAVGSLALLHPRAAGSDGARTKLWAGLSVNQPAFTPAEVQQLQIEFALVNDGSAAIDPQLTRSRIIVNGKDWDDSGFILGNGPRPTDFPPLQAGKRLLFGYALGDRFRSPGEYTVEWKGRAFSAAPLHFRVLSEKQADRDPAIAPGAPIAQVERSIAAAGPMLLVRLSRIESHCNYHYLLQLLRPRNAGEIQRMEIRNGTPLEDQVDALQLRDVNQDGFADIRMLGGTANGHRWYKEWVYVPATGRYRWNNPGH